jgi:hypothetical protein
MSQRAEELLAAARTLEVGEPPALASIRTETRARARRSAHVLAVALALPLGAAAAAGGWVMKQRMQNALPVARPKVQAAPPARTPPAGAEVQLSSAVKAWPAAESRSVAKQRVAVPDVGHTAPVAPVRTAPAPSPADHGVVQSARAGPSAAAAAGPSVAPAAAVDRIAPVAGPRSTFGARSVTGPDDGATLAPPASNAAVPAVGAATAARTSLSDETALLTAAVSALRGRHDAPGALEIVSQYRARFPEGVLARELTLVCAEAHRVLGHSAEALAELDALGTDARGGELIVLRAELRAELGRCNEAKAGLSSAPALGAALEARAARVKASCP